MHRRRLLVDLKGTTGLDLSRPIGEIEREIAVIEAGLAKVPDNADEGLR
jgi:hypothetical protein